MKTILIVDDNAHFRAAAGAALVQEGFAIEGLPHTLLLYARLQNDPIGLLIIDTRILMNNEDRITHLLTTYHEHSIVIAAANTAVIRARADAGKDAYVRYYKSAGIPDLVAKVKNAFAEAALQPLTSIVDTGTFAWQYASAVTACS